MTSIPATRSRAFSWTLLAAIAYVLAWVAGLLIGAPELTPADDGPAVDAAYGQAPAALLQAVLVHGVAGALIGVIAVLNSRRLPRARRNIAVSAGLAAAVLSFAQLAGEIVLTGRWVPDAAASVWAGVSIVDGIKMFALAMLIVAFAASRARVFAIFSIVAVVSLIVSGLGYIALQPTLMLAAIVSLPLLLVWAVWVSVNWPAAENGALVSRVR